MNKSFFDHFFFVFDEFNFSSFHENVRYITMINKMDYDLRVYQQFLIAIDF